MNARAFSPTLLFLVTKETVHFSARYFFGLLSERESVTRFLQDAIDTVTDGNEKKF
jgi:hypothetical protein